jgi:DNA-binding beta-propeller fold protein YncE
MGPVSDAFYPILVSTLELYVTNPGFNLVSVIDLNTN